MASQSQGPKKPKGSSSSESSKLADRARRAGSGYESGQITLSGEEGSRSSLTHGFEAETDALRAEEGASEMLFTNETPAEDLSLVSGDEAKTEDQKKAIEDKAIQDQATASLLAFVSDKLWKITTCHKSIEPRKEIRDELQLYLGDFPINLTGRMSYVPGHTNTTYLILEKVEKKDNEKKDGKESPPKFETLEKLKIRRTANGLVLIAMNTKAPGVPSIKLMVANAKRIADLRLKEQEKLGDLSNPEEKKKAEEARDKNPANYHFIIEKCPTIREVIMILQELKNGDPILTATIRGPLKQKMIAAIESGNPENLNSDQIALITQQLTDQKKNNDKAPAPKKPQAPKGSKELQESKESKEESKQRTDDTPGPDESGTPGVKIR